MSGYIVWVRGLRGPVLQKHTEPPRSESEHYKNAMLVPPIKMKDGDLEKSIDELRKEYPAPPQT